VLLDTRLLVLLCRGKTFSSSINPVSLEALVLFVNARRRAGMRELMSSLSLAGQTGLISKTRGK